MAQKKKPVGGEDPPKKGSVVKPNEAPKQHPKNVKVTPIPEPPPSNKPKVPKDAPTLKRSS